MLPDMWSLGLVMHGITNPEFGSPYRPELKGCSDPNMALKLRMRKRQLLIIGLVYHQPTPPNYIHTYYLCLAISN